MATSLAIGVLSFQETPLGCSLRMLGNLKDFMVFLKGSSQMTYRSSHSQDMHKNQSKIRLLTATIKRFANRVNRWRTYYAGRFIYKTITYKWIVITRKVVVIQVIKIQISDVFVTSECIHLYILCIVSQCLFQEVSTM